MGPECADTDQGPALWHHQCKEELSTSLPQSCTPALPACQCPSSVWHAPGAPHPPICQPCLPESVPARAEVAQAAAMPQEASWHHVCLTSPAMPETCLPVMRWPRRLSCRRKRVAFLGAFPSHPQGPPHLRKCLNVVRLGLGSGVQAGLLCMLPLSAERVRWAEEGMPGAMRALSADALDMVQGLGKCSGSGLHWGASTSSSRPGVRPEACQGRALKLQ